MEIDRSDQWDVVIWMFGGEYRATIDYNKTILGDRGERGRHSMQTGKEILSQRTIVNINHSWHKRMFHEMLHSS